MEFRDYATQETSALVERLLAQRSGSSLQQLQALREALEAAVRTVEATPAADRESQELVARLTQAADTAVQQAREEARLAREASQHELDGARRELEAQRNESQMLAGSLSDIEGDLGALRADLQNERERADASDRDLAATVEAHAEVEAALRHAEAACRHEAQSRAALEQQLKGETGELRGQLEDLSGENATLKEELASLRSAQQDLESSRQMMEAAARQETHARTSLEEELQEARGLLEIALAESTELRAELETRAIEMAGVKGELAGATSELSSLREQLASISSELTSARYAHEHLEQTYRSSEEARIAESQGRADIGAELRRVEHERHETEQRQQALDQQLQDARALLDMSLADTAQLKEQLEAQGSELLTLKGELTAARELQERRDAIAAELEATAAQLQTLEAHKAAQEENVKELGARLDVALEARERLSEQLAGQEREKSGARAEVGTLRGEMDRMVSLLDASVRAVDDLAGATTVAELFAALVERLSIQFSRVALFRLKGNRLEGEEQFGFDDSTDVTKLVLPLTLDSMVTRVASSATIERLSGSDVAERSGMPFGSGAASALALPIVLQGETLGVVYADYTPWNQENGSESTESTVADEASLGFAKLLVAQTGVLLMRHTHELKMLTELREYAAMLLQEAEHMYVADSEAGKSKKELRKRLKDNLDCASQLYAHRAALEGTAAAGLLDEQIAEAVAGSSAFAHDLASIAGQLSTLNAQVTAEAS